MKHLVLLATLSLACASTPPPPPAEAAASAPRRRRRRRPPSPAPVDPSRPSTPRSDAPAQPAGEFGSPVITAPTRSAPLSARLLPDGRIVCEGDAPPQRASTQSPYEPTREMIALAVQPLEAAVRACNPRTGADGRFTVRARVMGTGLPEELAFVEHTRRRDARCVGAAVCGLRMSAFRAVFTTIPLAFEIPPPARE